MLSNLIANAVRYGEPDSTIRVILLERTDVIEMTVENEGPRIPPGDLPGLFEPFRRGSSSHAHGGLGLGLYIVDQIVRAHGGRVRAVSGPRTTSFSTTWPRGIHAA